MQDPQKEQLSALLDNIYGEFVRTVAAARGKSEADVDAMLNDGIYGMACRRTVCSASIG